jgi:hypothetical protein
MATVKFDRKTRNAVAGASDNGPSLGTWLTRIRAIENPLLVDAVEGIWCGRSGEARLEIEGANSMLCVGWYNGRVEWSYLS